MATTKTDGEPKKDDEMAVLKKVMDQLRLLESGRARRRVMAYITERLADEEKVERGLPPGAE